MSLEAEVEKLTEENSWITKLIYAREQIPFVQVNLSVSKTNDPQSEQEWRHFLLSNGIRINQPAPLFPYPGSPAYTRLWGVPDDYAWLRAQNYYLKLLDQVTDIPDQSIGQVTRAVKLVGQPLGGHGGPPF